MAKKLATGITALLFVGSMFFLASCAKKPVDVSGGVTPPGGEKGGEEEVVVVREQPRSVVVEGVDAETAKMRQADRVANFENVSIYFDFDRSDLKPEAQKVLRAKAAFLRENPSHSVLIAGNCDERGTEEYNLALGERRAMAARDFLVALGIAPNRVKTISYGELRPADPAHNPVAWALNRRDTFKLFQ